MHLETEMSRPRLHPWIWGQISPAGSWGTPTPAATTNAKNQKPIHVSLSAFQQ